MNNISSSLVLLLDSYLSCGDSVVVGADASKNDLCIWVHPFSQVNQVGKLKPYWEDVKALVDSFCASTLGFSTVSLSFIVLGLDGAP